MRIVIIGPADARDRLAARLPDGFVIVGTARTIAEARSQHLRADAWLLAPDASPNETDEDDEVVEPETLTPREIEVLELLAQGLANKSIAARLGISDQTVKFHVASICGKLGVPNRTAAARLALRRGLIAL
jgi:DNA-binding NarL/FixJ family response regulator